MLTHLKSATIYAKQLDGIPAIQLLNRGGNIIEQISSNDESLPFEEWMAINDLFDIAKRQALGTDQIIDDIIDQLDDDIPF